MLHRIYIGSDNETKKLEAEKARTIINRHFEGYSTSKINGVWKGRGESTLLVEIETEESEKIRTLAGELRDELNQEAVGLVTLPVNMEFI